MKRILPIVFLLALVSGTASADLLYTQGTGTTIFDFLCFGGTKHCPAFVPETSAGTELFTSTTPGQVTGVNGTFPITALTLPLPVGAATAAKQPALGVAASPSSDVITVQGINSMTPLIVNGSGVTQPVSGTVTANAGTNLNTSALALEGGGNLATIANSKLSQGSATSGQKGSLSLGAVTTSNPSYTTTQSNPLSLDTAGGLRVNCIVGCSSSGGSSLADEGTFTQGTTSFTVAGGIFNSAIANLTSGQAGAVQLTADRNMFVNTNKIAGTAVDVNSGNKSAGTQRVVIATDQPAMTNAQPGNFSQIGGNTVSVGVGAGDNGTQRVAVANSTGCTGIIPINQTASTDIKTSTAKLHICSIILVSATAQSISLVEGTGTTCATGIAALIGGTTASMSLAANAGFSSISGIPWIETQTTGDHLCLLQSSTGNISGTITYADHS